MNHLTTHKHRVSSYLLAYKVPDNWQPATVFYICRVSSAQKELIMQNKPNLLNAQILVNCVLTMDYVNIRLRSRRQNKPNSKPIQSQSKPISNPNKPNFKPNQTQNEPKTNPISNQSRAAVPQFCILILP